jgi:hypothetical protein
MDEQKIDLTRFEHYSTFPKKTQVGRFCTYDLNYQNEVAGLRLLEGFAEGEIRVGPVKITRKYI